MEHDFNKLSSAAKLLGRQNGTLHGTQGGKFGTIFTAKLKGRSLEPFYSSLMSEYRKGSDVAIELINKEINTVLAPTGDKAHTLYKRLFDTMYASLKNNGIWTFWHYAALTVIVSHAYGELIDSGVVASYNLADQNNWLEPNWVNGVIMINFVAGKLYKPQLECFQHAMLAMPDLNVIATYLTHKLNER